MPYLLFGGLVLLIALLSFDTPNKSIPKSKYSVGDEVSVKGGATGDTSTFIVKSVHWSGSEWVSLLDNGNEYNQSKLEMVTPA